MGKRFLFRQSLFRNALACLIVVTLLLLAIVVIRYAFGKRATESSSEKEALLLLPPDVEGVMRGFSFKENIGQASIDISGKEAALRGRKLMVFRSNLAKTTFIKEISGTITSKKRVIKFAADRGEWDITKDSPLKLEHNVRLTIDGKVVAGVKAVKIRFNGQTVEAEGNSRMVYAF